MTRFVTRTLMTHTSMPLNVQLLSVAREGLSRRVVCDIEWPDGYSGIDVYAAIIRCLDRDRADRPIAGLRILFGMESEWTARSFEDRVRAASRHWRRRRSSSTVPDLEEALSQKQARRAVDHWLGVLAGQVIEELAAIAPSMRNVGMRRSYTLDRIDQSVIFDEDIQIRHVLRRFKVRAVEPTTSFTTVLSHWVPPDAISFEVEGADIVAITPSLSGAHSVTLTWPRSLAAGEVREVAIRVVLTAEDRYMFNSFSSLFPANELHMRATFPAVAGLRVRRIQQPAEYVDSQFARLTAALAPDSDGTVSVQFVNMRPKWFYGYAWTIS